METLAVVLMLIAFVGVNISIINIIYPIKAIGFVNRKRAALVFVLSFCLYVIGTITADVSTSDDPQNKSLWLSVLAIIAAYVLFRFVRRRSRKKQSARQSVPTPSVPDHEVRIRRQHSFVRKPNSIIAPSDRTPRALALTHPDREAVAEALRDHMYESKQADAFMTACGTNIQLSTGGQAFLDMPQKPNSCGGMSHVQDVWEEHASTFLDEIGSTIDQMPKAFINSRAGYILGDRLCLNHPCVDH